jgi:hypothetical protein
MRLVMASVIRHTFTDSLDIFFVGGCILEYIYSLLTMSLYLYGLSCKKVPYDKYMYRNYAAHAMEWQANNPAVSRVCINKEFSSGSFLFI